MFCICPQPNGFDPSTMGHFLESHVLEDDENCLRRPMTSMGVKGLRGNMVTSVRSGFKPFKHLVLP